MINGGKHQNGVHYIRWVILYGGLLVYVTIYFFWKRQKVDIIMCCIFWQERLRYENPHRAFTFRMHNYESVVGPVKGVYNQSIGINKPRGHSLLVAERPNFVTILALGEFLVYCCQHDLSTPSFFFKFSQGPLSDCLCGLVVRVPGCIFRGPGFDSRRYQIFWVAVGLKRGPLSLVRINEELLEWNSRGSGL
jgi:hypothetical protein